MFFRLLNRKIAVAASVVLPSMLLAPEAQASRASELEMQRDIYDQAQDVLDDRNSELYAKLRCKVRTYPLTPYTHYRPI